VDTAEELTDQVSDAVEKVVKEELALTVGGVIILVTTTIGVAAIGYFGGNAIKRWSEDRRRRRNIVLTAPAPKE
jgi:hypothetical protein